MSLADRSNLTGVTDANGNVTTYVVDDFGRTVQVSSPVTGVTVMHNDAAGQLVTRTDARGVTVANTYDAGGRLTTMAYDDGSATETLSYQYDAGGRRTRSESADVIQTFTHTRRGQILTADQEIGGTTRHTAFTYTLDGALDSITYPSGRVLTNTLDFAGRPTAITATPPGGGTPVTVLADAAYLPQGPAETLQLGPPAGRVTETLTHDWQYRRTAQSVVGPGTSTLLDLAYAYDPAGNLTALTDNAGTRTAAYAYDDLGRLTGVTWSDGTRSWEYDAIGNVTRLSVDSGLPGEGQVDYAYDVNPSGNNTPLLTTVAATSGGSPLWTSTLSTDPAGNITTDGASTYDYDLRNLLGDRQLGGVTSQHTFDAAGRRVETTRSDTGTTTELILGPAGQRLAKQENSVWRDYVWLGDRLIAYFDQGDTDPTLVFTNHIGMPLLATDGAGAPVWEAKAEPYGQLRGAINKIHDPALRYPGQWQDELDLESTCTGDDCTLPGPLEQSFSLFENGYRWYRPDWGRYTQSDPMGIEGGVNLFEYARADPFFFYDPNGLQLVVPPELPYTGNPLDPVPEGCEGGPWEFLDYVYQPPFSRETWRLFRTEPIGIPAPGPRARGAGGAQAACRCWYKLAAMMSVTKKYSKWKQVITCPPCEKSTREALREEREVERPTSWYAPTGFTKSTYAPICGLCLPSLVEVGALP